MTKRDVVRTVFEGKRPPYVPWNFGFTCEAGAKLERHFGGPAALNARLQNHFVVLGAPIGIFEDIGGGCVRDVFGVVWDRTVDKDIGVVKEPVLPEPTLDGYAFPDPLDRRYFEDIPETLARHGDCFRIFSVGFSLYERAWTLRGLQNLLLDFRMQTAFVRDLIDAIVEHNVAHLREALRYDIDAIEFGDDWGTQVGLQMGADLWREFIKPAMARMFDVVRSADRYVILHSCGDVDELFDELVDIGLNGFNPFQPEAMDVFALGERYRGRLTFCGGLSTQRALPYLTPEDVRRESRRLIECGRAGGYVFAPAHDVDGDVPLENMLAMIETAQGQPGRRL